MNESNSSTKKTQLWQDTSPKQFVVAFLRAQALWLFFNALEVSTYLPRYIQSVNHLDAGSIAYANAKFDLSMEILRIVLNLAAGILVIQYTAPLLNYLLNDSDKDVEVAEDLKK